MAFGLEQQVPQASAFVIARFLLSLVGVGTVTACANATTVLINFS